MKTIGIILLAFCGMASDEPKTSRITSEQRSKFWRAQAEATAAHVKADRADATLDAAVEVLKKACGDQQLIVGQDGEPTCGQKTEALKEEK